MIVGVCVYVGVWWPEDNLQYHFSGIAYLLVSFGGQILSLTCNSLLRSVRLTSERQESVFPPPRLWDYKHTCPFSFIFSFFWDQILILLPISWTLYQPSSSLSLVSVLKFKWNTLHSWAPSPRHHNLFFRTDVYWFTSVKLLSHFPRDKTLILSYKYEVVTSLFSI